MCATITYLEYLDVHYKSRINYWLKLSQAKLSFVSLSLVSQFENAGHCVLPLSYNLCQYGENCSTHISLTHAGRRYLCATYPKSPSTSSQTEQTEIYGLAARSCLGIPAARSRFGLGG